MASATTLSNTKKLQWEWDQLQSNNSEDNKIISNQTTITKTTTGKTSSTSTISRIIITIKITKEMLTIGATNIEIIKRELHYMQQNKK